jgi:glycosyltransferase EpsF
MIRVLQITPALDYGGVSQFLMHYYDCMDHEMFCFDFITHEGVEDFHEQLLNNGSRIYYFKREGELGLFSYYKQYCRIGINSYDIIHIHLGHYTGLVGMVCRVLGAKRIICHAHTTKCMNKKHEPFMPVFRMLANSFSDALFSCGQKAGEYCFGKHPFTIIPNGVDLQKFRPACDEQMVALKQSLGLSPSNWIIGCVANFVPPKNHGFLIDVFSRCYQVNKKARLVLVGDGPLRKEIEKEVEEKGLSGKVIFAGVQKDIPLFLSLFDIFALTSVHEGFPVVAAEAQAVGVKCVYSANIDKSCDLGLGLMSFLPITKDYINEWASECLKEYNKVSRQTIEAVFKQNKFEIQSGALFLSQNFMKLMVEQ